MEVIGSFLLENIEILNWEDHFHFESLRTPGFDSSVNKSEVKKWNAYILKNSACIHWTVNSEKLCTHLFLCCDKWHYCTRFEKHSKFVKSFRFYPDQCYLSGVFFPSNAIQRVKITREFGWAELCVVTNERWLCIDVCLACSQWHIFLWVGDSPWLQGLDHLGNSLSKLSGRYACDQMTISNS